MFDRLAILILRCSFHIVFLNIEKMDKFAKRDSEVRAVFCNHQEFVKLVLRGERPNSLYIRESLLSTKLIQLMHQSSSFFLLSLGFATIGQIIRNVVTKCEG